MNALSQVGRRTAAPPISWLMRLALEKPQLISLAAGFTDSASLPRKEAAELLDKILSAPRSGQAALQYGTTLGQTRLRRLTAERIRRLDRASAAASVYAPERFIITSGSQQLLYMVTEALCDPGDIVLVEDPTYFVYLGIMQSHGLRGCGIRMQEDGLDLAHLEATLETLRKQGTLPKLKLLYLVSYFQNPTGICTSYVKKLGALELLRHYERAAGHPIYLVEDVAYRELRFAGKDEPSALAAGRRADRVILAGTYSKPFATGARVGFGVLPEPVFTAVERIKGNHDFGTSNLLQQLLADALATGKYEQHVAELRRCYARKAGLMTSALHFDCPKEVHWQQPLGGLYVWARAPRNLNVGPRSKFFQAALDRNVLYVPGELCYAPDSARRRPAHEMRLSYGGAKRDEIPEGVARLGRVFQAFL